MLIGVSQAFNNSTTCNFQIDRAQKVLGVHNIIPLRLEKFKPTGWLKSLLKDLTMSEFDDEASFPRDVQELKCEIAERGHKYKAQKARSLLHKVDELARRNMK